jgi:hypothetical protein
MMKVYSEGARRILTGQKKLSTILITRRGQGRDAFEGKMLTAKRMAVIPYQARLSGRWVCGKAEDGSG